MMDLDAFFSPFTTQDIADAPVVPSEDEFLPILPVPGVTHSMDFKHPTLGASEDEWSYVDKDDRLLGYTMAFGYTDADGKPATIKWPVTYCAWEGGSGWRAKRFPEPWPLFQLKQLHDRETATILVCEDERTAMLLASLFPEMVPTTIPFGLHEAHRADLSVLSGRSVVVASDSDEVCYEAYNAGAAEVWILRREKLAQWQWRGWTKHRRNRVSQEWTFADALNDGWTADRVTEAALEKDFLEIAPRLLVNGEYERSRFRMADGGVEREVLDFVTRITYWERVSGSLELIAETRDGDQRNWGKLLRITDDDGRVAEWHMSNDTLAGDGAQYRDALQNRGLKIEARKLTKDYLHEYLSTVTIDKRARRVDRVGWHGEVFVTSSGIVGQSGGEEQIVFAGNDNSKVGATAGTLAEWNESVAKYAVGNSKLIFALSAAFSAPLLFHTNSESGGFHFVGNSSIGKTTTLLLAGSVWGGGGTGGYLRSWRATSNGLEGVAASHCDSLLCLDEMGQVGPREAGQCAYMLANGTGKTRANRFGDARKAAEWRVTILSTGEVGLADKVSEDFKGAPPAAGQQLRIIDMVADAGAGLGIFENLHGFATASDFARLLKGNTGLFYGQAGKAFVEHLVEDVTTAAAQARQHVDTFIARYCPKGDVDGQVRRVAHKFGLVAAAGEMAMAYGIVPWPQGEAINAVGRCFEGWLQERGTHGSLEEMQAVAHVRACIERHGATRFFDANNSEEYTGVMDIPIRDRLGFVKEDVGGRVYCFFSEAWKKDVCKGRDHKLVSRALLKRGFLLAEPGRLNKVVRVKNTNHRVFVVRETILAEPEEMRVSPGMPLSFAFATPAVSAEAIPSPADELPLSGPYE